jgi:hypothetical protein
MKAPEVQNMPVHTPNANAEKAYQSEAVKAAQGGNPFRLGAFVYLYTDASGDNWQLIVKDGRQQTIKADRNNMMWFLSENSKDWNNKIVVEVPTFGKWYAIVEDTSRKARKAASSTFKGSSDTPVIFSNDKAYYVADGQPVYKYEACE